MISGFLENQDQGSGIGDQGSRIGDRGPRIEERGSRIEDQGSRIKDRGSNGKKITSLKFVVPDLHDSCCYCCLGSLVLQDLFQVSKYLLSGGKVQNFP